MVQRSYLQIYLSNIGQLQSFELMKKSPFIEGFREPTLSKNAFYLLSDVTGDGQGKLVIWSQDQKQLIVYRGTNRELQKNCKIKHVNGMIQYYDQQINPQPVIAISAQNALYIFRGLVESFRLKIPDICAQIAEQMIWSQHMQSPDNITTQLMNIKSSLLSQKAKYYLGANSIQQKQQIIQKVFNEGISEKDSICAMAVIKEVDATGLGNVIIGTQLNRLYILDSYGHKIICEIIIDFAPCFIYAYGKYQTRFAIVCISRSGIIALYTDKIKDEPSQLIRLNTRIISADLSYPDFIIATADNVISLYSFSHNNFKLSVPKYSMKLNQAPIKVIFLKQKGLKLTLVGLKYQFRILREKQIIYRHETIYEIANLTYGSFAKQQNCLILMYEKDGFEVLITHRMFNPREKYEAKLREGPDKLQKGAGQLVLPKKTGLFLKYWSGQPKGIQDFRMFERAVKLLKWRTLRQRNCNKKVSTAKVQVNSRLQNLGPHFLVSLEMENVSKQPIFNIFILYDINETYLQVLKQPKRIYMLPPFTPIIKQFEVISSSLKAEKIQMIIGWQGSVISTFVNLPACQEIQS